MALILKGAREYPRRMTRHLHPATAPGGTDIQAEQSRLNSPGWLLKAEQSGLNRTG